MIKEEEISGERRVSLKGREDDVSFSVFVLKAFLLNETFYYFAFAARYFAFFCTRIGLYQMYVFFILFNY